MTSTVKIVLGIVPLAVIALILTANGGRAPDPLTEVRVARLSGTCPVTTEEDSGPCDVGGFQQDDWCYCMTTDPDPLPDEVETVPLGLRRKMLICDTDGFLKVRYHPAQTEVPDNCYDPPGLEDLKLWGVSSANVWTDVTVQLEAACAPCQIRPNRWGPCPYCLHPSTPTCAEACP